MFYYYLTGMDPTLLYQYLTHWSMAFRTMSFLPIRPLPYLDITSVRILFWPLPSLNNTIPPHFMHRHTQDMIHLIMIIVLSITAALVSLSPTQATVFRSADYLPQIYKLPILFLCNILSSILKIHQQPALVIF